MVWVKREEREVGETGKHTHTLLLVHYVPRCLLWDRSVIMQERLEENSVWTHIVKLVFLVLINTVKAPLI